MAFLVATTSLPAVYRPNGYARTTTAGTPHARANYKYHSILAWFLIYIFEWGGDAAWLYHNNRIVNYIVLKHFCNKNKNIPSSKQF